MDTSEIYIKMCEKAEEIQETKRYGAFSDTSPSAEALILDDHDFYGVHEGGQYYPNSTIGSHNIWNATVFGYVSNNPQYGCAVQSNRRITYKVDEVIWLPRQDQLQEMLQPCGFGILLWDFHTYASILIRDENIISMEQLWLAFVMKTKYNKVWSGEDWLE